MKQEQYYGMEFGPIRPPSEARSLLVRLTRNCPWNRCTFCPVYKGAKFSLRPVEHIKKDIDLVRKNLDMIRDMDLKGQGPFHHEITGLADKNELPAFNAARQWYVMGMESIFLQDANSLIMKPENLYEVLAHLKKRFPMAKRITSYARSRTVARIKDHHLKAFADAGLNRIHIGLESGSDVVLKMVKKGVTKADHIKAGLKVLKAGIELSEYVMPGLGGKEFSELHALETADALNRINPHFIRLRTLVAPPGAELFEECASGGFRKSTDVETVEEIRLFLENLGGIESRVTSDHVLNLFDEVEGKLPDDRERMLGVLTAFLGLEDNERCLYQAGRRIGIFSKLSHLTNSSRRARAEQVVRELKINPDNVDSVMEEMMKRFV